MNKNNKTYDYGKCHVCGEQMQEKRINQAFWVRSPRVSKGVSQKASVAVLRSLYALVNIRRRPILENSSISKMRAAISTNSSMASDMLFSDC